MDNAELYHYGRKGMKWGQNIFGGIKARKTAKRRAQSLEKARQTKAKNKAAADKRAKLLEKGRIPVSKMTDAELKARIERLNLEKTYRDLKKGQTDSEPIKRFVDKISNATIDKVAENAVADVVSQAVKVVTVQGTNKVFGSEVVYTNNKKKG